MKKFFKASSVTLLMVLSLFIFTACGGPSPKDFSCDAGLTITLTDEFVEQEIINRNLVLINKNSGFFAEKTDFNACQALGLNENSTEEDYAKALIRINKLTPTKEIGVNENNLTNFDYELSSSGLTFYYHVVIVKGSDAFWNCQFYCQTKNVNELKPQFSVWEKSIRVI